MPRLMVSCDAVVRDSAAACGSGTPQRPAFRVEAKHRFPSRPAAKGFVFMGAAALPHSAITLEHFVQCQMQMMVLDTKCCNLISYFRGEAQTFIMLSEMICGARMRWRCFSTCIPITS